MAEGPKNTRQREAVKRFRKEVCEVCGKVDPGDQYDWFSLSLGFFLALGLSLDVSHRLSLWCRYDQQYWHE